MINLVIFASDAKGTSSLNSIINEANNRGINLFVMVCQDTQLRYPTHHKDRFEILTNVDSSEKIWSKSLNTFLPFKPDWLIIQRERWEPETSIILEFKQSFGCKIGVVEQNSWVIGNAEGRLESISRNRFKNLIDVFFTHSTHSKTLQQVLGFEGNMVITGNPKYDTNLTPKEDTLKIIKDIYKVDPNKKQVLLFSLMNTNRKNLFKLFKTYIEENPHYQFYFKPYPGEPFMDQFKTDYYPNFFLKGVTPILEESHIWSMFNICDIHVGCLSSIFHASLLLKKEIVDLSKELNIPSACLEKNHILNSRNIGIEDSKDLWLRSLNINEDQLKRLLSKDYFNKIQNFNNKVWDNLDNHKKLLILFDDFNDNKSSHRILDYINEK